MGEVREQGRARFNGRCYVNNTPGHSMGEVREQGRARFNDSFGGNRNNCVCVCVCVCGCGLTCRA
jgi:hypothetical protein